MSETLKDTVRDRVVAILAEHAALDPREIRMTANLQDLGIDSLGLVEAVFAIEEAFDIQVPFNANTPSESEFDITSVGTMVRAVETLVAAQS